MATEGLVKLDQEENLGGAPGRGFTYLSTVALVDETTIGSPVGFGVEIAT